MGGGVNILGAPAMWYASILYPCCGMNSVPSNSYVEAVSPNMTVFGGGTFKEVIKVE